jgi:hypothetical protein
MATLWPVSLPQDWEADGFSRAAKDLVIRSEPDAGPEMTRPRATAFPKLITCSVAPLSATQVATLDAFWEAEAGRRFQWKDHAGNTRFYAFRAPPSLTAIAGGALFRARLALTEYVTEFGGA